MKDSEKEKIIQICKNNDISMIGIFGSTARGDSKMDSDIDILIKLSKPKSLLSVVKMERMLSEALGRKVDLVTEKAISPYLRDRVFNELMVIYEA